MSAWSGLKLAVLKHQKITMLCILGNHQFTYSYLSFFLLILGWNNKDPDVFLFFVRFDQLKGYIIGFWGSLGCSLSVLHKQIFALANFFCPCSLLNTRGCWEGRHYTFQSRDAMESLSLLTPKYTHTQIYKTCMCMHINAMHELICCLSASERLLHMPVEFSFCGFY